MKNKYRVVDDKYSGFEVQVKFWWFPVLFFQCAGEYPFTNTHPTLEKAKEFMEDKYKGKKSKGGKIHATLE